MVMQKKIQVKSKIFPRIQTCTTPCFYYWSCAIKEHTKKGKLLVGTCGFKWWVNYLHMVEHHVIEFNITINLKICSNYGYITLNSNLIMLNCWLSKFSKLSINHKLWLLDFVD